MYYNLRKVTPKEKNLLYDILKNNITKNMN